MSEPTTAKSTADLTQDLLALGCDGIRWTVSLPSFTGVLTYSRFCPTCGVRYDRKGEVSAETLRLALLEALAIERQADLDDAAHGNVCLERAKA